MLQDLQGIRLRSNNQRTWRHRHHGPLKRYGAASERTRVAHFTPCQCGPCGHAFSADCCLPVVAPVCNSSYTPSIIDSGPVRQLLERFNVPFQSRHVDFSHLHFSEGSNGDVDGTASSRSPELPSSESSALEPQRPRFCRLAGDPDQCQIQNGLRSAFRQHRQKPTAKIRQFLAKTRSCVPS